MKVVGLGKAGCAIADAFSKFAPYEVYKFDTGIKGPNCFHVTKRKNHEEYEAKFPSYKKKIKNISGEVLFVMAGSGDITGCCLRLLEQLAEAATSLSVLYIQPDLSLLSESETTQEKIVSNVLQEYARSGRLERMYMVSNNELEKCIGEVPIMGYYDALNQAIVNTFHMLNVFKNSEAVLGTFTEPMEISRISTMGVLDIENNKEKWFFDLHMPRDVVYYYGISKEILETDNTLFKQITTFVKSKLQDNVNVSYGVYETNYEQKYCYCIKHSSVVQSYVELLDDQEIS